MDKLMPWIILAALLVWSAWPMLHSAFLRWRAWREHRMAQETATRSQHEVEVALEVEALTQTPELLLPLPQPSDATTPHDTQLDEAQPLTERVLSPVAHEHTLLDAQKTALLQAEIEISSTTATPPQSRTPEETQVLVVDDSKVLRVKISRLLMKHGYRVSLAEDGAEAARHLAHTLPHLLITDVDMPVMNGLELSQHVRNQPRTADLPIIMITSAQEKYAPQAAAIGVKVVLAKPYRDDELIAHVTSSLTWCAASPAVQGLMDANH